MYRQGQPVAVKTPGDTEKRLMVYDGSPFDEFAHVRPIDSNVDGQELVLLNDVEDWLCPKHGHVVPLYVDAKVMEGGEGDTATIEAGTCRACGRRITRAKQPPRAMICGTCEDTGWIQDLHQKTAGIRGTVPCPTCFKLDADR